MKKFFIALFAISFSAGAFSADYPTEAKQQRLEKRSGAYNKAAGQAMNDTKGVDCYYRMSGCSKEQLSKKVGITQPTNRKPLAFPKQGYVLKDDGLYHFKDGAQSRN
jgi:hypothetical protein